MRKHDVRKWLHAILDLLPVILIPVFMIYSHRHTIDSGSIQVPQNEVVDFNQTFPVSWSLAHKTADIDTSLVNDGFKIDFNSSLNTFYTYIQLDSNYSFVDYHKYLFKFTYDTNLSSFNANVYFGNNVSSEISCSFILNNVSSAISIPNDNIGRKFVGFYFDSTNVVNNDYYIILYPQLFDLTQMFGSGNEPTIEQFNLWYNADFYDYTLSHKELLKGVSYITYDDTDIMSQATYQLYNAVDKYFNVGNVFHLGEVYDWFNLNIFNGNAPISIYIVYQIVLYELIMDLLFLLYSLFMWFIDMIQKLMEKPLNSIK